jgi:hypothetical protein
MKKALITGITGQDGSYLAELLLHKGYEVHGIIRRSSSFNTGRINHIYQDPHESDVRLFLHYGDLNDASSLNKVLRDVRPEEIYNLGAQSHVKVSFDVPEYTGDVDALGSSRILEGDPRIRSEYQVLPGLILECTARCGNAAEGDDAILSPQSLRLRQGLCLLHHGELPGSYNCTPATAFSSTTSHPGAARPSSPARSRAPPPASSWGCRTSSTWATWTPSATGATPATTSKPCG